MTGGTSAKTSRTTAVMNGSTISARTRPAVSIPMPIGGPENSGSLPSTFCIAGCTWVAMSGASTKSPHIP